MCDDSLRCCLRVDVGQSNTKYVSHLGKKVDLRVCSNAKFAKEFSRTYTGYDLVLFAKKLLGLQQYGVIVTHRAKAHLTKFYKETPMSKLGTPATPPAAAATDPKAIKLEAPTGIAALVKEPKAPKEPKLAGIDGEEPKPRNRREKFDGTKKIKVLAENPARVGTIRHGIVDTIFAARTVDEALQSNVERKDGTEYKIGVPDIYFALENGLIELY